MDTAIRIEDIKGYVQRRQAYLSARKDAAEAPADKGKIIGMLQALADFEGMIRQLRVRPASSAIPPPAYQNLQMSCDDLARQWLSALALPGACLDDFREDARQNRVIARHPDKREKVVALGQLVRNKPLVDSVLNHLRALSGGPMEPTRVVEGNGGMCPYCGKTYKYVKSLAIHVTGCPKKPPT